LPDGLVGEGAGAGDDADRPGALGLADMGVDVAGHDADLAARLGIGIGGEGAGAGLGARGDDAGAVGADEGDGGRDGETEGRRDGGVWGPGGVGPGSWGLAW